MSERLNKVLFDSCRARVSMHALHLQFPQLRWIIWEKELLSNDGNYEDNHLVKHVLKIYIEYRWKTPFKA